eukprot:COSAG02_NODE_1098_length_14587_cov_9.462590_4_plen_96_part_00
MDQWDLRVSPSSGDGGIDQEWRESSESLDGKERAIEAALALAPLYARGGLGGYALRYCTALYCAHTGLEAVHPGQGAREAWGGAWLVYAGGACCG